jgi:hypothetical protein
MLPKIEATLLDVEELTQNWKNAVSVDMYVYRKWEETERNKYHKIGI